jgi:hypothetical protein
LHTLHLVPWEGESAGHTYAIYLNKTVRQFVEMGGMDFHKMHESYVAVMFAIFKRHIPSLRLLIIGATKFGDEMYWVSSTKARLTKGKERKEMVIKTHESQRSYMGGR